MSFDVNWDIDKYRDDHESEDHWQLRRAFMEKWKNDYPEDRLVCLARVFTNVELLGCRYPQEVMLEISRLSQEVAESYRKQKKNMLQRTFVSASDAAEDRAKGIKRKAGVIIEDQPKAKIQFTAASSHDDNASTITEEKSEDTPKHTENTEETNVVNDNANVSKVTETIERVKAAELNYYLKDLSKLQCLPSNGFREYMFKSIFGRMILLIRPWASKLWNIQASCQACNVKLDTIYQNKCFALSINGQVIAQASGETKLLAKTIVECVAWEKIKPEVISILVKEQWLAHNDTPITLSDVACRRAEEFGKPLESSVAMKMMQMMGWKGGGLGAEAQGIAEPIKPNMQLVDRAGLGSMTADIRALRRSAGDLMRRYISSDTLDLDLVFSSEFSKEERAQLHQCAQSLGLASKSYGDKDRFLVVKKKVDPFSLARAVIDKGGTTPKYQVFIPAKLGSRNGRIF